MIKISTDVICDECSAYVLGESGDKPAVKSALNTAREAGWVRVKYQSKFIDLCPKCAGLSKYKKFIHLPIITLQQAYEQYVSGKIKS